MSVNLIMSKKMGRPKQNLTNPVQIRFDIDVYDLLLEDVKRSGADVNSKVREILRMHYQSNL